MKTSSFLFLIASLLSTPSNVLAQIFPGAIPWINAYDGHLTSAFDANGDGLSDILDLNRAQGSFTLGLRQPDGTFIWSQPSSVGFSDVESMAVGRFLSPAAPSFMVTSRSFNNVQPVPLDGSDLPAPLSGFDPPEPQTLATIPVTADSQGIAIGYAGSNPEPLSLKRVGQNFSPWQNFSLAPNARHAGTVYLKNNTPPVLTFIADAANPAQAILQVFRADENECDFITEWSGLPQNSRFAPGFFTPDFSSQNLGYQSTTFITWSPGTPHLRIARLTSHDVGNHTNYEDLTFLPLPLSFNMQLPISHVSVLYKPGGHRLLLTFQGQPGIAAIYDFDGINIPTLIESLPLNGLSPDAFTPLAGGEFLVHGMRNGQPAYDLFSETSPGHYTVTATGTRPTLPNKAFYSNVIAFSGEPFVNVAASAVKRARVLDWTTHGTAPVAIGSSASITSLSDSGQSIGLGNPATDTLSVPETTSHLLFSQISPLSSISFHSAKSVFQSQLPVAQFSPAAGTYPPLQAGEGLEIIIEVPGAGFDVTTKVSVNDGPWQFVSRFQPLMITAAATLKAYSYSYLSGMGPIVTADYTFGNLAPLAAPTATDADMNGLADDWEALTGITNPAADDDGDGFLNLAEHNAGFDPANSASKPDAVAVAPNLQIFPSASPATPHALRWDASDTAILLETSADLQSWTLVTHGTRIEGNERVFDLPTNSFVRRFYRLRR